MLLALVAFCTINVSFRFCFSNLGNLQPLRRPRCTHCSRLDFFPKPKLSKTVHQHRFPAGCSFNNSSSLERHFDDDSDRSDRAYLDCSAVFFIAFCHTTLFSLQPSSLLAHLETNRAMIVINYGFTFDFQHFQRSDESTCRTCTEDRSREFYQ